jgi:hypothetical protein
LDNRRPALDLRVIFVPLGTPAGGRIKAFVMSETPGGATVDEKKRALRSSLRGDQLIDKGAIITGE